MFSAEFILTLICASLLEFEDADTVNIAILMILLALPRLVLMF